MKIQIYSQERKSSMGLEEVQAHQPPAAASCRSPRSRRSRRRRRSRSLTAPIKKTGGRNNNGRITTRHQGGGHKRRYRVIDFKRRKDGVPAKVAAIEYDPNRSARIALLHYADGAKAYILAPAGLRVGATVESGAERRHQGRATRCRSRTSRPARSSTTSS